MTDRMDEEYWNPASSAPRGTGSGVPLYVFSHDTEIASDAVAEAFAQCIGRGDRVYGAAAVDLVFWAFKIAAGELDARRRWV